MTEQGDADPSYSDRLRELEDRLLADVAEPARLAIIEATRRATAAWVRAFGSVEADPTDTGALAAIRSAFVRELRSLPLDLERPLLDAAVAATWLGVDHAGVVLTAHAEDVPTVPAAVHPDVMDAARSAREMVSTRLDKTVGLVRAAGTFSELVNAMADAHHALAVIRRQAAACTFGAAAHGVTIVTEAAGVGRVWVAERDACLHCLGHAGHVVAAGEDFPAGLTYSVKPSGLDPVAAPPLHPNCRCTCSPWRPEWTGPGGSFPAALAREAQRSVLKGWSLESESNTARLAAAAALLRSPLIAPASVKAEARRAVRRGAFASRVVPTP